jgi:hypothetical protein
MSEIKHIEVKLLVTECGKGCPHFFLSQEDRGFCQEADYEEIIDIPFEKLPRQEKRFPDICPYLKNGTRNGKYDKT